MQGLAIMDALVLPERDTEWMDAAACKGKPAGLFFPEMPQDPSKAERQRYNDDVARAKEVCAGCPVRAECFLDARDRNEHWGIWGGEDFYIPWRKLRRGANEES